MWGSTAFYFGIVLAAFGTGFLVKPVGRLGVPTRRRALGLACGGLLLAVVALILPAFEARATTPATRLDEFMPVWQFQEIHTIDVAASSPRVFEAIRQVRADEIRLFSTLAWIRRGGRESPTNILNPGNQEPIMDVATRTGFLRLVDDGARELVIGAAVIAPAGMRSKLTPELFRQPMPPGVALVAMNFLVTGDGPDSSTLTTETRVCANSPSARRQFAAYWRVIYPGSALIRRSWLRAIARRATGGTH
jgi:hypothetical protein